MLQNDDINRFYHPQQNGGINLPASPSRNISNSNQGPTYEETEHFFAQLQIKLSDMLKGKSNDELERLRELFIKIGATKPSDTETRQALLREFIANSTDNTDINDMFSPFNESRYPVHQTAFIKPEFYTRVALLYQILCGQTIANALKYTEKKSGLKKDSVFGNDLRRTNALADDE